MSQTLKKAQHTGHDYAISDVQGCFVGLMRLLDKIQFNEKSDRLWFVGDLVNRGPHSLEVLRFVKNLPLKPYITLGNHDLYLISLIFTKNKTIKKKDTLQNILKAHDAEDIGHWLRGQSIIHYDNKLNVVMTHAGIPPIWGLEEAILHAKELELALKNDFLFFLENMLGNSPDSWSNKLSYIERLRIICNYFTRMRYCRSDGSIDLEFKGSVNKAPKNLYPWFAVPGRISIHADIVFGHWASLNNINPQPCIHAIDTGFVWGGGMTAFRLQDKQRFTVDWDDVHDG